MKKYDATFLAQHTTVKNLRKAVIAEEKKLQELCPHVHLDGTSAFPRGLSFTDCTLCGMSSHDVGSRS